MSVVKRVAFDCVSMNITTFLIFLVFSTMTVFAGLKTSLNGYMPVTIRQAMWNDDPIQVNEGMWSKIQNAFLQVMLVAFIIPRVKYHMRVKMHIILDLCRLHIQLKF